MHNKERWLDQARALIEGESLAKAAERCRIDPSTRTFAGINFTWRSPWTINSAIAALRFFFTVTLERPDLVRPLRLVTEPRRTPVVLSPEEAARLLEAAPSLKYKAALSVAYGAGLRVSEVANLKVSDIDSLRMALLI